MVDPRILISIGVGIAGVALVAYLAYRWRQLKHWASNWLKGHPMIQKIVCDVQYVSIECAAAIKRGANRFAIPVAGIDASGRKIKVISEEEISVDCLEDFKKKIRENPILAMQTA